MRKLSVLGLILVLLAAMAMPTFAQDATPEPAAGEALAVPPPCAASLAPRLVVGQRGELARRFSSLRAAPAGRVIQVVRAPASFTVLEGPVCAGFGPIAFFRVDYGNGQVGWAAESQVYSIYGRNSYWLRPVTPQ